MAIYVAPASLWDTKSHASLWYINAGLAEVMCKAVTVYLESMENMGLDAVLELRHYVLIMELI